jgi:hypothetical protein
VVLEALASGRRVVATSVGGTPDLVSSTLLGEHDPAHAPDQQARAHEVAVSPPYHTAAVSLALDEQDWGEIARRQHDSLLSALDQHAQRAREAA